MAKGLGKNKAVIVVVSGIIIAAIVTVIVSLFLIKKNEEVVSKEDFFKTGENRIVLKMDTSDPNAKRMGATKMYQVYNLKDGQIDSVKMYIEFENEEKAEKANDSEDIKQAVESDIYAGHELDGKYVILDMPASLFEGVDVSTVRNIANEYEESQKEPELPANLDGQADDYVYDLDEEAAEAAERAAEETAEESIEESN